MLDRLNDVQAHDLELDELREEKGRTPPELIEARARKEELEERLAQRKSEREALQRRVSQNEMELQSLSERRKGAADAALRADTSKEASQYQNQELQFATRLQELEEDTMPLLGELESLDGDIAELEGAIGELEPVLGELSERESERLERIDARIGDISGEREGLAKEIDRGLLRQYEQVRRARRGLGLVPVLGNERCGGCNVKLPIHVVQKTRKGGSVVRCPSCGRILWAKD